MIDPRVKLEAERWAAGDVDADASRELLSLLDTDDAAELVDRMAGPLAFGTAGLRGVLGAGPNRMNRAVVVRTTAGLANYLQAQFPDACSRGVVVGHDARRMSCEFAEDVARVLAGAGLVAHVFPSLATTPQTAFATTALGAVAGIMITASHNPPEYNGYKVYWSNGAQIIPPHDARISEAINAIGPAREVPRPDVAHAQEAGLWRVIGCAVTREYLAQLSRLSLRSEGRDKFRIVYTPMHGVGRDTALAAFSQAGFRDVVVVAEQAEPDGTFPTVSFPNPEEPGAMDLAFA
ncbi:MAG: phospho-sugar mutase, partial [Polyangiaceae bacterium]|nr:phospho-sugar mutase [Polyangiaceae bacterium]